MPDKPLSVALIGAGRMGLAVTRGLVGSAALDVLHIHDPYPSDELKSLDPSGDIRLNGPPEPVDAVILAVKPQIFAEVAPNLSPWFGQETVAVSIMAGIKMADITAQTGARRVVRAMPNLPSMIGSGAVSVSLSDPSSLDLARALLSPLGLIVGPLPEDKIGAVIGIAGSAPAYVFALVETLAETGEALGLDAETAMALARQTVIGSGELLRAEAHTSATALREAVTSPGGTTQAALEVLMAAEGLPSLIHETAAAAIRRDRELAGEPSDD